MISLSRYWANFSISRLHRFLQPLILSNTESPGEEPEDFAKEGNSSCQQTSGAVDSLTTPRGQANCPRFPPPLSAERIPAAAARTRRSHRRPRGGRTRRQAQPARSSAGDSAAAQPGGRGRTAPRPAQAQPAPQRPRVLQPRPPASGREAARARPGNLPLPFCWWEGNPTQHQALIGEEAAQCWERHRAAQGQGRGLARP